MQSHANGRAAFAGTTPYPSRLTSRPPTPPHTLQAIFLGQLSSREVSRLSERLLKFVVFKVVFCGALIIPDIYEIVLWLTW